MVVRSTEPSLRTDHRENHPLLHGDAFRGESGLLQTFNHGEAVVTLPRENSAGEHKAEDNQAWGEEHGGDTEGLGDRLSYRVTEYEMIRGLSSEFIL